MSQSFIKILEDKIRQELRKELEFEGKFKTQHSPRSDSDQMISDRKFHVEIETWLVPKMKKAFRFAGHGVERFYPSKENRSMSQNTPSVSSPSPEYRFTPKDAQEIFAVELLERASGETLPSSFTSRELKSVWKKAVFARHPDRHFSQGFEIQEKMKAEFQDLLSAHAQLQSAFTRAQRAQSSL